MALASVVEPELDTIWQSTLEILRRLQSGPTTAEAIDQALDTIVEVLGADRGLLLLSEPSGEVVVNARSAAGALAPAEREEIGRTLIRRAREAQGMVFWDPIAEAGGSLGELGVLAAVAAPVHAPGEPPLGFLYVDVREPGKSLGEGHERFLEVATTILAPVLRHAHAIDALRTEHQRREVREEEPGVFPLYELLASPALADTAGDIAHAVGGDLHVLILGESGTGKTELARSLAHARGDGPVVRATLGTSHDLNTITSELFGHCRGAFSGAVGARSGLVAHADGGTLVLDEILNLPLHAQQLLLDVTQFGTYRPLGYDEPRPKRVALRIIAATNGDLETAIREGTFRADLYHRLAGVVLRLPPLRERRGDIPALAKSLLHRRDPARDWHLSLALRRALSRVEYAWPGNLRELEALVLRARARALAQDREASVLTPAHLDGELGGALTPLTPPPSSAPPPRTSAEREPSFEERWASLDRERDALLDRERAILEEALDAEDRVVARVARRLGVPRTTLVHRMQILGITLAR